MLLRSRAAFVRLPFRCGAAAALLALCGLAGGLDELSPDPIAAALQASEDLRVYNDHLVTLASPFMEGRVPGSRGMEIAMEYVEFWFEDAGLEPAFAGEGGAASFRQPFPLRGATELARHAFSAPTVGTFAPEADYTALALGGSGRAQGNLVFVGYSIPEGKEGYASYAEGERLDGRIALVLRFEPMDASGKSLWGQAGWSAHAGLARKVRAAVERGAAGVLVVNTPGADDARVESLPTFNGAGRKAVDVPVFMITGEAAERLIAAGDGAGRSLLELRQEADLGPVLAELAVEVALECEQRTIELSAENVGGLLAGRGALAEQLVVIGAHLDHLGQGSFGSRDAELAGKALHPGADDNASGTAGVLMLADKLARDYAALPPEVPLRSVLFLAFSAEESGLHGANFYVEHPIRPLEQHALMMNFDMIGRIANGRLAVAGTGTAQGLGEWLEPIFQASELEIVPSPSGGGGSDHLSFMAKGVPVLFGIIADFHEDYHTPRDTSDKINRVDAVKATLLWREIALAAVQRAEPFVFTQEASPSAQGSPRTSLKVRFGIRPGDYAEGDTGVAVAGVTDGGSAALAGVLAGDVLVSWNGEPVANVRSWMEQLALCEPGDRVQVGLRRGDSELEVAAVLQPAAQAGQ